MILIKQELVKSNHAEFINKVIKISRLINIDPNWLMQIMWFESKLEPQAVNPITHATGLIQFMPDTAKQLGTSAEALKQMTNLQQLDFVYKYFLPFKGKLKSFRDTYFAVFFPTAIDKPGEWILQTKNLSSKLIAKFNSIFDLNKDGQITVNEVEKYMLKFVPQSIADLFKKKQE